MTDTEQKALALVNEVAADALMWVIDDVKGGVVWETLCLAIEQHEQFKREVSDAIDMHRKADGVEHRSRTWEALLRFIIAKPDPLVEAWLEAFPGNHIDDAREECAKISAALASRGLTITETKE